MCFHEHICSILDELWLGQDLQSTYYIYTWAFKSPCSLLLVPHSLVVHRLGSYSVSPYLLKSRKLLLVVYTLLHYKSSIVSLLSNQLSLQFFWRLVTCDDNQMDYYTLKLAHDYEYYRSKYSIYFYSLLWLNILCIHLPLGMLLSPRNGLVESG